MAEALQLRVHDPGLKPTLVYLPGLHGDWTLLAGFRQALAGRACLAEFTYPRRVDWSLDDYARALEAMLIERGLTHGWIVAESFSSQVAWALIAPKGRGDVVETGTGAGPSSFVAQGLILAGGFVRHPLPFGVWLGYQVSRRIPIWLLRRLCEFCLWPAKKKHGGNAEVSAGLREFVARRSNELDRAAITRRYRIILENDPRAVARCTSLPTFLLTGGFDPIVPWRWVRAWLRRHCPGYRGCRIVRGAGHAVLLDAPRESARQILDWVGELRRRGGTRSQGATTYAV